MKDQAFKLINVLVILIGILLLIEVAYLAVAANLDIGLLALSAFAVALIVYGILWYREKVATGVHAAVITIGACMLLFIGFLAMHGSRDTAAYDEDAVIVLGAAVHGEQVSLSLASRLDRAIEYHAHNPHAIIVVSGGQGSQESISEALAMERYLIERGVPADRILKEDASTSTLENFLFSDARLQQEFPSGYTAVVITNDFHVYRAVSIAESAGITARHLGAPTNWYTIPYNYLREMMAVVHMWLT